MLYQELRDEKASEYRNKDIADISALPPLEEVPGSWYENYCFIAHSGGGIDGKIYTQSQEAWEQAYRRGTRVFDADLNWTSDGEMVLRHEWSDDLEQIRDYAENPPTYEEFMQEPVCGKYTSANVDWMLKFMKEHEDVYVACDCKENPEFCYESLLTKVQDTDMMQVLDRIIVSLYSYEDFERVKKLYPFQNWVVRQYKNEPHNYTQLAAFCVENEIPVVMIGSYYLDDGDDISILTNLGIHVYAAVVDRLDVMLKYREAGVSGFVSNWLYEEDIVYLESSISIKGVDEIEKERQIRNKVGNE